MLKKLACGSLSFWYYINGSYKSNFPNPYYKEKRRVKKQEQYMQNRKTKLSKKLKKQCTNKGYMRQRIKK